jgi:CDP-diacylglycerol--glycerol-3-phosphate 3-phosphatidyltransferase
MLFDPDLFCSLALTAIAGALAIAGVTARPAHSNRARSRLAPHTRLRAAVRRGLDCLAEGLMRVGVSANAITLLCLGLAAVAGVLLGFGHFGLAAVAMVLAASGDALDGLVARRSGTASVGGALLDASVDRYGEFFFLAGFAVYFRGSVWLLVVTLFALAGSFMVSYGSAKAEAIGTAVPPGGMRRTERAVSLCAATTLATPFEWLASRGSLPGWAAHLPLSFALALVAVGANVSAIHRLRLLAHGRSLKRPPPLAEHGEPATAPSTVSP